MNNQNLESAYVVVSQLLDSFLADIDLLPKLDLAFGSDFELETAKSLIQSLIARDNYPEVEIIATSKINGANGAFAASLNKVFLSQEFVNSQDADSIAFLLLEELGHYLDWQLNPNDTAGDEGAVFSALVRGETLSSSELQQLQNEDDWAAVSIEGVEVAIEQQRQSITPFIAGSQGSITIPDDRFPRIPIITRISIDDRTVSESDGTARIIVSLSNPVFFPVTVNYSTANNTATAGSDYIGDSDILTFAPGQTLQIINIPVLEDSLLEGDEQFFVNLFNPSRNTSIADGHGIITIKDNDSFPTITINDVTVSEGQPELQN